MVNQSGIDFSLSCLGETSAEDSKLHFMSDRTRCSAFAYIAAVTFPVCVFCWLG